MLDIDALVDLLEYVGGLRNVDAFEHRDWENSRVELVLNDDVQACSSFNYGGIILVEREFPFHGEIVYWSHPTIDVPYGI